MPKKKEDMTPEEYETMKARLAEMREKSKVVLSEKKKAIEDFKKQVRAKKVPTETVAAPVPVPAPVAAPVPVPAPAPKENPTYIQRADSLQEEINQVKKNRNKVSHGNDSLEGINEDIDLEKYFEAKYKAKSKYYPKKQQQEEPKPIPAPQPVSQQLLYQSASQQIRQRVNEDLMKMAMRNVFGDY
jgi:hypothetical protein